jgi:hypothetical protein
MAKRENVGSDLPSTDTGRGNAQSEVQEHSLASSQAAQRLKQISEAIEHTSELEASEARQGPLKSATSSTTSRPANILHEAYPASNMRLGDHSIDDVRSLKVVIIGAGLSGILAGILLPVKVPKIQLTILEKNEDVVSSMIETPLPAVNDEPSCN